jgi:hypothetical protein
VPALKGLATGCGPVQASSPSAVAAGLWGTTVAGVIQRPPTGALARLVDDRVGKREQQAIFSMAMHSSVVSCNMTRPIFRCERAKKLIGRQR